MTKILITGANGQLGSELSLALQAKYGAENIVDSDITIKDSPESKAKFVALNVMDSAAIKEVIKENKIDEIYHLAAVLSANAEKSPLNSWDLNMKGLLNILELGKEKLVNKIFWPSSIAVFGPSTPKNPTLQDTIMNPNTVYGISKLAGERWCDYYFQKYGVDVRSIRYPGIISYKTKPGGGTTDYAVDIFHHASRGDKFLCFLKEDTLLPMIYIEDAVRGTVELMAADSKNIKTRSSYNMGAVSFTPKEIFDQIKSQVSDFEIEYRPDFRQNIADSWPNIIDDNVARNEWNWNHKFDITDIVSVMLKGLRQ